MQTAGTAIFQMDAATQWEDAAPGVRRQIFGYDDRLMLVKAAFDKGAEGTLHHHPHSQATYVASGIFDVTIDGKIQRLKEGDGFYVPPGATHGCVCIEEGLLIDVFSPAREDFISS